ncbi:hypothetical protein PS838_00962 [Pseudomonas fluorescens]|nr:hypothetical protein PS838_00962 [Pseudomonas fluorescens]
MALGRTETSAELCTAWPFNMPLAVTIITKHSGLIGFHGPDFKVFRRQNVIQITLQTPKGKFFLLGCHLIFEILLKTHADVFLVQVANDKISHEGVSLSYIDNNGSRIDILAPSDDPFGHRLLHP